MGVWTRGKRHWATTATTAITLGISYFVHTNLDFYTKNMLTTNIIFWTLTQFYKNPSTMSVIFKLAFSAYLRRK